MAAIFINLTDDQMEQLKLRFSTAKVLSLGFTSDSFQFTLTDELATPDPSKAQPPAAGAAPPPPLTPVQREDSLDAFVRRCFGTMIDLETLQQDKGALVIVYPDGSYRQVEINTKMDGSHLPKVIERVGRFRRLRRSGGQQ